MLSSRNEWIAIAILLVLIAFVPCPMAVKEFYGTPLGKAVAVGVVVYTWKYVSQLVAVLLVVMVLFRGGGMREFLDETGVSPTNFKCDDSFIYVADKKMCAKGNEMKAPTCNDASMMWDSAKGECIPKAPATPPPAAPSKEGAGGPPGGTSPGAAAAMNELANANAEMGMTPGVEGFVGYQDQKGEKYAPA